MGAKLKAVKGPSGRLHLCRHGRQLRRCGCGGQGCCYCANVSAKPGEPCFVQYKAWDKTDKQYLLPPERYCNPKPSCCGGRKFRVHISQSANYEYAGSYNETATISEFGTFTIEAVGPECATVYTPEEYAFHLLDIFEGEEYDKIDVTDTVFCALRYINTPIGKLLPANYWARTRKPRRGRVAVRQRDGAPDPAAGELLTVPDGAATVSVVAQRLRGAATVRRRGGRSRRWGPADDPGAADQRASGPLS